MIGATMKWLRKIYLFPLMMLFAVPDEGGGEAEPDASATEPQRPEDISEEEWDNLSKEEREGYLMDGTGEMGDVVDDDDEPPELTDEQLAAIAGATKPAEAATETPATETPAADGKPAEGTTETLPVPAATDEKPVISDEDLLATRVSISDSEVPLPADVPEDLSKKMSDLDDKFEAGEIQLRDYNRERDAINREIISHQVQERDRQRDDKLWEKEQSLFLNARPEYLEKSLKGDALFGALNQAVQTLNNDPKNSNKSGIQILIEADRAVREAFNMPAVSGKKAPTPAPAAAPAPAAPVKPAEPKPAHQTLASVPTSTAESISSDPFSALDRLDGEAYEKALEKLTPEQRDMYLSRA